MTSRRKPPEVVQLSKHYRPSRHAPKLSPLPSGTPAKPEWLSAEASIEWDRAVALLEPTGWLSVTDEHALALFAELYASFRKNPTEMTAALVAQLRVLMGELGMTPGTRAKMPMAPREEKGSPFDGM